jgi:uncharacterized membrane protein YhdT
MKSIKDPRIKHARKSLLIAWIFFFFYISAILLSSYLLGIKPYLWGLPRWVSIGCIIVPFIFVILLIFVVEKFFPDIALTDDTTEEEAKE